VLINKLREAQIEYKKKIKHIKSSYLRKCLTRLYIKCASLAPEGHVFNVNPKADFPSAKTRFITQATEPLFAYKTPCGSYYPNRKKYVYIFSQPPSKNVGVRGCQGLQQKLPNHILKNIDLSYLLYLFGSESEGIQQKLTTKFK